MLLICRQLKWLMRPFHRFSGYMQTMHPPELFLFILCVLVHLCRTRTRECVRRCASVSQRVGIKAGDDPFFVEQTLRFDRSLPRHYCSLGASALLIQHPQVPHAYSQSPAFEQTPPPKKIYDVETRSVGILPLVRFNKLCINIKFLWLPFRTFIPQRYHRTLATHPLYRWSE